MRFNLFLETNLAEAILKFKETNLKADIFLNRYLREKRIGKRDRLWISDRFYYYLRHRNFFDSVSEQNEQAKDIAAMFEEELTEKLKKKIDELKIEGVFDDLFNRSFSPYLKKRISECFGDDSFEWFNTKSAVTVRTNFNKTKRDDLIKKLESEGYQVMKTPVSPAGIIILNNSSSLKNSELFSQGLFEFQDESSQIVSFLVNKASETMLDCCAGGGGKSLAVKSFFQNISISASDNRTFLFKEITERAARAGIKINTCEYTNIRKKTFSTVFIDAPCSGSGVLRRNPGDRYAVTEKMVEKMSELQLELISEFSQNVSSGGELIYVTCSFLKEENEGIVEKFLEKNDGFKLCSANDRLKENIFATNNTDNITSGYYCRTAPFSERDLMFGAIMKKIR